MTLRVFEKKNADSELRLELPVELISEPGSCASALTVL